MKKLLSLIIVLALSLNTMPTFAAAERHDVAPRERSPEIQRDTPTPDEPAPAELETLDDSPIGFELYGKPVLLPLTVHSGLKAEKTDSFKKTIEAKAGETIEVAAQIYNTSGKEAKIAFQPTIAPGLELVPGSLGIRTAAPPRKLDTNDVAWGGWIDCGTFDHYDVEERIGWVTVTYQVRVADNAPAGYKYEVFTTGAAFDPKTGDLLRETVSDYFCYIEVV